MARVLIVKLGAAGDVVRTTPIMRLLVDDDVDWFVLSENAPLLGGTAVRVLTSTEQLPLATVYDLVISLEEDLQTLVRIFAGLQFKQVIGSYPSDGTVHYTVEAREW